MSRSFIIKPSKKPVCILVFAGLFVCVLVINIQAEMPMRSLNSSKYTIIEDFDSGEIELKSFEDFDHDPDAWVLDSTNTYQNSQYSLKLFGKTWKLLEIDPVQLDASSVWQAACYVEKLGGAHGFGITDGKNILKYSFAGGEMLDIEDWLTVYQGFYPDQKWNIYQLPVGDDWLAWHRYEPEITGIVFINDNDEEEYDPPGIVNFDFIADITDTIVPEPTVNIFYTLRQSYQGEDNEQYLPVKFNSKVFDPKYDRHDYYWEFGDGNVSRETEPVHTYKIGDEHCYTVFLAVRNEAGKWGYASTEISPPKDKSSLPLTINFVGDVILARRYEEPGGIIPMQGVEAIFEPTLHVLGEAADLTVINLEAPLTTSDERHPTKGICFKGDPDNVEGLVYGGVDVASLANNHILDFMLPGLQETQQVLEDAGILHCGAGANSYEAYLPAFVTKKGINIAFIASSDRTGQYNNYQPYLDAGYNRPGFAMMTPYYVREQIRSVRDVSDLVVNLLHSGSEYSREPISHYDDIDLLAYGCETEPYYPDTGVSFPAKAWLSELEGSDFSLSPLDTPKKWDRAIRRFMIDSGSDLVINHHTHIIQGLELYQGKIIAHSLGNFIFDSFFTETMPSMILNTEADKNGFNAFSVTPVYIDHFIPREAKGQLALHILDYLARRSKDLDTYLHVDRENLRASVIMDTTYMEYHDIENEGVLVFEDIKNDRHKYRSQPMRFARQANPHKMHHLKPGGDYSYRLGRELVWFGNVEDEGCNLWNTDHPDIIIGDSVSYEGERSLMLQRKAGSGSLAANLHQRVRVFNPQKNFTLHGLIKTENAVDVDIEVRYYTTRWTAPFIGSDTITVPISGTTDWTYYYKELEVPERTRTVDFFFRSTAPDSGKSYAWFDNIGIIEWGEWEPYQNNTEIVSPSDYYYLQMETNNKVDVAFLNYSERAYEQGFPPTGISEDKVVSVAPNKLHSNYPNPFNVETTIRFSTNRAGKVGLSIYNIKGQRINTLIDATMEKQPAGSVVWKGQDGKGRNVASGVYFYQLRLDNEVVDTKKCLLLK